MKTRYTNHQVPRGTRADAEIGNKIYLLKKVRLLNATYQVRLLAFRAQQESKRLIIRCPGDMQIGDSLKDLMDELGDVLLIEREV